MIDRVQAVRELMLANAALATAVSTRVYHPRLPESHDFSQNAIVFTLAGDSELDTPLLRPVINTQSWGNDSVAVEQLYGLLRDALHDCRRKTLPGGAVVLNAFEEVAGQTLIDPDVKKPYVVASFRAIFRGN